MAFVLLFSFSTTALADELPQEESHDLVSVIAVADVNGNYVQYELYDNTVTEIPIYAVKEGQPTRDLEAVATLTIGLNDNQAVFIFTSINVVIATITKGFTGEIVTFFSGIRYGYNSYEDVLSGSASAGAIGSGRLSGTYSVAGHDPVRIFEVFSW